MNNQILKEWIKEIWKPNTSRDKSYLMLWDSFACHKDKEIIRILLEDYDTAVEIIPGGCTSVLQPLDVGINKPLKDKVRRDFQDWPLKIAVRPPSKIIMVYFLRCRGDRDKERIY